MNYRRRLHSKYPRLQYLAWRRDVNKILAPHLLGLAVAVRGARMVLAWLRSDTENKGVADGKG